MSDDMSMVSPSSAGEHGVLRSMQEVAMSSQEASKMLRTYNIAWWGNNYYDVNELGHISVCPDPDVPEARGPRGISQSPRGARATFAGAVLLPADPAAPLALDQRRLQTRVNRTVIMAITSLSTRLRLTSTVA